MKKRTRIIYMRIFYRLLIILLIIGALYTYFGTNALSINNYIISGIPAEQNEVLTAGINEINNKRLFYILPGNKVISFHKDRTERFIKEILPDTEKVKFQVVGLHDLRITVVAYSPLFKIDDTHAITSTGVIYEDSSITEDLPYLEIPSDYIVNAQLLVSISELLPKVDAVLYPVHRISIDGYGDVRLINATSSHSIIISSSADFNKVWSNIISAIDTDPLKTKLVDNKEDMEYIDTRFGNKIFYKFTSENDTDIIEDYTNATTTSTTTESITIE